MDEDTNKALFIRSLAEFISGNSAAKSIAIQVEGCRPETDPRPRWADEWAKLRGRSPVTGWKTVDETEEILKQWLL